MSTVFRVEKNANFTVMSNYHLKDRRLSYKAKGLMSTILSLPPDWDYTLSGLAVIAADGNDSVRSALCELERYGYLIRYQRRDELGRMSVNEYVVYECPEENPDYNPEPTEDTENPHTVKKPRHSESGYAKPFSPSLENPTTEQITAETPSLENPTTENPLTENPSTGNPTTDTIYKLNTNILNTHQSNHSINRACARETEDRSDRIVFQEDILTADERDYYRDIIRENIQYEYFYTNRNNPIISVDMSKVDEIVSVMVDVVCSRKKTIRVNGEDLPQGVVKKRFLELDESHIEYVITAMNRSNSEIRNIRAYLITALYNAPETMDSYYEEWVKRNMFS